jgi:hypothetical protein
LVEYSDKFDLLAELAIAVAGFAGVASAFGGRERSFGPAELIRLKALFQFSALVLTGCFSLAALASAGIAARSGLGLVFSILILQSLWFFFRLLTRKV